MDVNLSKDIELTIFIVTFNARYNLFRECCLSIISAIPASAELRIVLNGEAPLTEKWLKNLNHPQVFWNKIPTESRSKSRNRAFLEARGKIIYFLDDDVIVPQHLFLSVIEKFKIHPDLIAVGGPNLTPPKSQTKEKICGATLTSFFAAPFVRYRYSVATQEDIPATQKELILCNLAVKNTQVVRNIGFKQALSSNEENLLLFNLKKAGYKILYSPQLFVYHHRRKNFIQFFLQILSYGLGRGEQFLISPASTNVIFLIPTLSLILGVTLLMFSQYKTFLILAITHLILGFLASLFSKEIRKSLITLILSPLLTIAIHGFYGLGFIRGILKVFKFPDMKPPIIKPFQRLETS